MAKENQVEYVDQVASMVGSWEWWQVCILATIIALVTKAPNIIKATAEWRNQSNKNHQKHLERMRKLDNQVKGANEKLVGDKPASKVARK